MIEAVVLAAGGSRRLGGQPKQLLRVEGVPLLARVLTAVRDSALAETIVVTGYRGDEVRAAAGGFKVRWLDNPDWSRGMAGSLRVGLAAVDPGAAGAAIVVADQPFLSPGLINRLIDAFAVAPVPAIVRPAYGGQAGHPVLLDRFFFDALEAAEGDQGGREVLAAYARQVITVPAGPRELMDVDTWADAARCAASGAPDRFR